MWPFKKKKDELVPGLDGMSKRPSAKVVRGNSVHIYSLNDKGPPPPKPPKTRPPKRIGPGIRDINDF